MANGNQNQEMPEEEMAEDTEAPEETDMAPVQEIVGEIETALEGMEGMDREELIDEAIATLEGMKVGGSALGGLGGEEDFELPEPEEDIMA